VASRVIVATSFLWRTLPAKRHSTWMTHSMASSPFCAFSQRRQIDTRSALKAARPQVRNTSRQSFSNVSTQMHSVCPAKDPVVQRVRRDCASARRREA